MGQASNRRRGPARVRRVACSTGRNNGRPARRRPAPSLPAPDRGRASSCRCPPRRRGGRTRHGRHMAAASSSRRKTCSRSRPTRTEAERRGRVVDWLAMGSADMANLVSMLRGCCSSFRPESPIDREYTERLAERAAAPGGDPRNRPRTHAIVAAGDGQWDTRHWPRARRRRQRGTKESHGNGNASRVARRPGPLPRRRAVAGGDRSGRRLRGLRRLRSAGRGDGRRAGLPGGAAQRRPDRRPRR